MHLEVSEGLATTEDAHKSWLSFGPCRSRASILARQEVSKGNNWAPAHLPLDMEGRRIFDTALGILIGFRRCSSDAAFHELLGAAQRHGFPAFPMAWALVHLAGGGAESAQRSAPRNRLHGANGSVLRAICRADGLTADEDLEMPWSSPIFALNDHRRRMSSHAGDGGIGHQREVRRPVRRRGASGLRVSARGYSRLQVASTDERPGNGR